LEANGHTARIYWQRVVENPALPLQQQQFVQQSLHRLAHPDAYDGSLGVWVAEVKPTGNFAQSGIRYGDVMIALNGAPIDEPLDIAMGLAKHAAEPVLLTILREQQKLIIRVKSGELASALLTQLVILTTIQL
jgi:S1-C subfamily serine protease